MDIGRNISGHISPADISTELFKPFKDRESFLVSILKNWKVLYFGFFVGDVIIRMGFGVFWMTSSAEPMSWFCSSKFYWILGYDMSL